MVVENRKEKSYKIKITVSPSFSDSKKKVLINQKPVNFLTVQSTSIFELVYGISVLLLLFY